MTTPPFHPKAAPTRRGHGQGARPIRHLLYALVAALTTFAASTVGAAQGPGSAAVPVSVAGVPVLSKLSAELLPVVATTPTLPPGVTWAKGANAKILVKVLIVAASPDPDLVSLRADILARGGSVFYNFLSVRCVAAMVPAAALPALTARTDVLNIAPNRAAERQASLLQASSDAGIGLPGFGTTSATDGKGVSIAVLDSGIDFRHRNLMASDGSSRVKGVVDIVALSKSLFGDGWSAGKDYSPSTKTSLDGTKYKQADTKIQPSSAMPDAYGHGTAVAAVAAGLGSYQAPDSSGIATGATLYDVRVLNDQGVGNVADVLAGIDWVVQRAKLSNIRVMNLSLGAASTDSFLVDPLARAARGAVASGIVVVVAAGNAGKDANGNGVYGTVSSPGNEPSVITVGAENTLGTADRGDDVMTSFSSRGPTRGAYTFTNGDRWVDNLIKPDLVAPGNKVLTASAADASGTAAGLNVLARTYPQLTQVAGASQTNRQTLMTLSGTSIAAPAVSGAAAVLLQVNPGLTPPLVKAILQYTATPLAKANLLQQGTGLLNVEGAVRLARALRSDISTAVSSGTLLPGANLLAPGMTMPTPVTTIGGSSQAWSRMAYAGGTHLVTGDALFSQYQPVWDPALTWARHYALRSTVSYYPASSSAGYGATTIPYAIVERNATAQALLTAGVRLLDSVAATSLSTQSATLMTPVTTLKARADAGAGLTLGLGFVFDGIGLQAEGFVLSQGFILNEGFILREGFILNEGFILREGFILNEGFILREGFILDEGFILRETLGDAPGTADRSLLGD